jgi:UDP-N-acetylglucosamine diphosphorylase/glucosamine-1-phosphate N-acetyltransferase
MNVCLYIFEDDDYEHFYPLTCNRPVYLLLSGAVRLWQKWYTYFPGAKIIFLCRNEIAPHVSECSGVRCNRFDFSICDKAVFINGRAMPNPDLVKALAEDQPGKLYLTDGNLSAATLDPKSEMAGTLAQMDYWGYGHFKSIIHDLPRQDFHAEWLNYIWDVVAQNPDQIKADFQNFPDIFSGSERATEDLTKAGCLLYNPNDIRVAGDAVIDGQTVLDARRGPIIIANKVRINSHTRIEGPCYIGPDTQIVGAKVREGCSFGPNCRVGGEVEESIFLGYSNKYHEGFLGHAYLGEWVNLGALTTNSDLKNNLGTIRVDIGLSEMDTGLMKVGSFMGDHVKTGIGTLLNTGISIGFCSNIFGGGLIKDKFVPAFAWGGSEGYGEYRLDKALETASIAMRRRDVKMTDKCEDIFKLVFENTKGDRSRLGIE